MQRRGFVKALAALLAAPTAAKMAAAEQTAGGTADNASRWIATFDEYGNIVSMELAPDAPPRTPLPEARWRNHGDRVTAAEIAETNARMIAEPLPSAAEAHERALAPLIERARAIAARHGISTTP